MTKRGLISISKEERTQNIHEKIDLARDIVESSGLQWIEYKKIAFELILKELLEE